MAFTCFKAACFSYSSAIFLHISEDLQGNHVPPGKFIPSIRTQQLTPFLDKFVPLNFSIMAVLQHLPVADLHSHSALCTLLPHMLA